MSYYVVQNSYIHCVEVEYLTYINLPKKVMFIGCTKHFTILISSKRKIDSKDDEITSYF